MKASTTPAPITKVFRAVSDRTRLRILSLLRGGEICVCHLVAVLRIPQPTASRHLAYLRKAGLVVARKEGLWMYYGLAPARTKSQERLWECLRQCFGEEAIFGKDEERLRARVRPES